MIIKSVRPTGFEPVTYYLASHYNFRYSAKSRFGGLDYIFTVSGAARVVSTEPVDSLLQIL